VSRKIGISRRWGWTKIWLVMISSLVRFAVGIQRDEHAPGGLCENICLAVLALFAVLLDPVRGVMVAAGCGMKPDRARELTIFLYAIAAGARFLMARWRNGDAGTGNRLVSWFNSRLGLHFEPHLLLNVILGRASIRACVHQPDGEFVGPDDLVGFVRTRFQPLDLQIERLAPEKSAFL
jgi:hypothetical protein